MLRKDIWYVVKTCGIYGTLAFLFSIIGVFHPNTFLVGSPLEASTLNAEHILGHIGFGLIVGIASFSLRHFAVAGLFSIILDADHLIQFFDIEMIPRMAHSVTFGMLAAVLMIMIFGRQDARLAAIAFASVLSHIAFDVILSGSSSFPLVAPFSAEIFLFVGFEAIIIQVLAIVIVGLSFLLDKKREKIKVAT